MNRSEFEVQLEAWIADFRSASLEAFDSKCAHERCLVIGASIADARNAQRQKESAGAVMVPPSIMRGPLRG